MIVLSEMAVLFFISQFGFIYEISSTDRNSRRSNKILDTPLQGILQQTNASLAYSPTYCETFSMRLITSTSPVKDSHEHAYFTPLLNNSSATLTSNTTNSTFKTYIMNNYYLFIFFYYISN